MPESDEPVSESTESPEEGGEPDENVRIVQVMAPFQFGAMKPPQVPAGPNCPVVVLLAQGGWRGEATLSPNDAMTFASHLRRAAKEARGGIQVQRAALLGANGAPIAVPVDLEDELDDDDLEAVDG